MGPVHWGWLIIDINMACGLKKGRYLIPTLVSLGKNCVYPKKKHTRCRNLVSRMKSAYSFGYTIKGNSLFTLVSYRFIADVQGLRKSWFYVEYVMGKFVRL